MKQRIYIKYEKRNTQKKGILYVTKRNKTG